MKHFILTLQLIATLFAFLLLGGSAHAQTAVPIEAQDVDYTLPYTGLLPDHPLYFMKLSRDGFWLFLTRDSQKKAELLLLFSDKKIAMAQALAEKGKWEHVVDTLEAADKDVRRMMAAVKVSKDTGSSPSQDFLDDTRTSSKKHLEIMKNLLKQAPDGTRQDIEAAMRENLERYNELQKL